MEFPTPLDGTWPNDVRTVIHYKSGPYLPLTENWIYGQISNLKRYKPIIYCHGMVNYELFGLENIRAFGKGKGKSPLTLSHLIINRVAGYNPIIGLFIRKDRPSLLHAHFGGSGYYLLKHKIRYNLPLVTSFYGTDLSRLIALYPEWIDKYVKLFNFGDVFLAEGEHMKQRIIDLGCDESKVIIHHIGVDLNDLKYRKRERMRNNEFRILIAASFREKKGIPDAIKAVSILKSKYPQVNIEVTLIGDSSGAKRDEIEKEKILGIIRSNEDIAFRLTGYRTHDFFIEELYRNDVYLAPSLTASDADNEGGAPVSIIEASATGMPVVSTYHCDIPEVVIDGESGFLVPERDVGRMADCLERLLLSKEECDRMGYLGRMHIERNFDSIAQAKKLECIYDKLILES